MLIRLATIVSILAFLTTMIPPLSAQPNRGAMTFTPPDGGPPLQLYRASKALVIGMDAYTDSGWPRLRKAVEDAHEVEKALRAHGFEVIVRTNLSAAELEPTIRNFFIHQGADPEARLLLWFAGHGHTLMHPVEEGYLVPIDAPGPNTDAAFREKALAMSQFGYFMSQAKAKHVLAVFDSCFSGSALDIRRSAGVDVPTEIAVRASGLARQMISSGDRDQMVSDNGVFRTLFLDVIAGKVPGVGRNGYVTARDIGNYLSQEMAALTGTPRNPMRQTPNVGYLNRTGFNRGDFVFRMTAADGAPTSALAAPPVNTVSSPIPPAVRQPPPVASDAPKIVGRPDAVCKDMQALTVHARENFASLRGRRESERTWLATARLHGFETCKIDLVQGSTWFTCAGAHVPEARVKAEVKRISDLVGRCLTDGWKASPFSDANMVSHFGPGRLIASASAMPEIDAKTFKIAGARPQLTIYESRPEPPPSPATIVAPSQPAGYCDALLSQVKAADTNFNSTISTSQSAPWIMRTQLPGWQRCRVYENGSRRYSSCSLGPFGSRDDGLKMIEAVRADVKACLGDGWVEDRRSKSDGNLSFDFESSDVRHELQVILRKKMDSTWELNIDVNAR